MHKTTVLSFKDLKQRISIEHVLRHYDLFDGLRIRGKSHRGPCPFCEAGEGVPFSVSLEKGCFQCFACKTSGNILDFVARSEGVSIREASLILSKNFTDPRVSHQRAPVTDQTQTLQPEETKAPVTPEPPATVPHPLPEELPSRNEPLTFALKNIDPTHPSVQALGFPEDTVTHFGIGYYSGKGMMGNHIVIPVHNTSRELVAYAGFHPEERTYIYPPKFRRELELYNLGEALASDRTHAQDLILVRHPLEALRLISAGYHTVALMGEAISTEQVDLLLNTYGRGKKLTLFWPTQDSNVVDMLSQLLHLFFVRLIRYEQKDNIPSGFTADDARALLA